jgi:hypothetical protein
MPGYDASRFDPPAPTALITLCTSQKAASVSAVPMLLDTGADVTLLPRSAVEQLGIPLLPGQGYQLLSFDGSKSFARAVILDVIFLKRLYRGRYLLTDEACGILGRDILNHVTLLLNGPRQEWWEQPVQSA